MTDAATSEPAAPPVTAPHSTPWLVLGLTAVVATLNGFGLSVMPVAFPSIVAAFPDASTAELSWVSNIFPIVGAATFATAGVLAERWGRKSTTLLGVAVFLAASVAGALSSGPALLIASRGIMAVGASLYTPAALAILISTFPRQRLSLAVGVWAAAAGSTAVFGPVFGGALVDALGWQWAFWINVPMAVVVLVLGPFILPRNRQRRDQPLPDQLGVVFLISGISLVVLGIVQSPQWGWLSIETVLVELAGGLALVLLVRRCLHHPHPALDLQLLRVRAVALGDAGALVYSAAYWGTYFAIVLFMIDAWGYSAGQAGLASVPAAVTGSVAGIVTGRLANRFSHRALGTVGCLLMAAVAVLLLTTVTDEPNIPVLITVMTLLGLSCGMAFNVFTAAGVARVPEHKHAIGAGINMTANRLGSALGIALAVTFLSSPTLSLAAGLNLAAALALVTAAICVAISLAMDA